MQGELHGNVAYHGVELLLLVSMFFLLAIPKSLLILKKFFYTLVNLSPHYGQAVDLAIYYSLQSLTYWYTVLESAVLFTHSQVCSLTACCPQVGPRA